MPPITYMKEAFVLRPLPRQSLLLHLNNKLLFITIGGLFLTSPALAVRTLHTTLKLKVYARSSGEVPDKLLGFTPPQKNHPIRIPQHGVWYVRPIGALDHAHLERLARLVRQEEIPGLDLSDHWELSNASLSHFAALPSLIMLDISRTKISDAGLRYLKSAHHMEVLLLPNAISDNGISAVKSLHRLRELNFDQTRITDRGLNLLVHLPNLQNLDLSSTHVSDAGIAVLKQLPHLERLVLGAAITDASAIQLATLKHLKEIDLSQSQVGDKALAALGELPNLQTVYLPHQVSEAGLKGLAQSPSMRVLDLTRCTVTDNGVKELSRVKTLQELAFGETAITNASLPYLAKLSELRMLELSDTHVTSAGLAPLASLKHLEVISLSWQKLTREDLQGMAKLKQLKAIVLNGIPLPEATMVQLRHYGAPSPWDSISGLESAALHETTKVNQTVLANPVPTPDTKLSSHAIPELTQTAYHPISITSTALSKSKGRPMSETFGSTTPVTGKKGVGLEVPTPTSTDLKVASIPSKPEPITFKSPSPPGGREKGGMRGENLLQKESSPLTPVAISDRPLPPMGGEGNVRAPIEVASKKASEENLLQVIALQSNPAHAGGFSGLSGMRQLRHSESLTALNTISTGGSANIEEQEDTPETSLGEISVGVKRSH
jgi:Leucine-rich repeat (LRR) protein